MRWPSAQVQPQVVQVDDAVGRGVGGNTGERLGKGVDDGLSLQRTFVLAALVVQFVGRLQAKAEGESAESSAEVERVTVMSTGPLLVAGRSTISPVSMFTTLVVLLTVTPELSNSHSASSPGCCRVCRLFPEEFG